MPNNTKARHEEIYSAAVSALESAGGVVKVDQMGQDERLATLRDLYKQVVTKTKCHRETAKSNVAKALRRARFKEMESHWGGAREGAGYPKGQPRKKTE